MSERAEQETGVDEAAVDTVLTAGWCLAGIAAGKQDGEAGRVTAVQYRVLRVLASRGPERMAVLVSVTAAGRRVIEEVTERRRQLIRVILARLPVPVQHSMAAALRAFADAASEVTGSGSPVAVPAQHDTRARDQMEGQA